jgi:predicted esterase
MKRLSLFVFMIACFAGHSTAYAQSNTPDTITVLRDVVYGEGLVGKASGVHARNLLMDVYTPSNPTPNTEQRPAILLAFGGSVHRGDPGDGQFAEHGAQTSSMADYCRLFARNGYVCFSMEYRLFQDDPALSQSIDPTKLMPQAYAVTPDTTKRVDFARQKMGLAPLDEAGRDQFWRAVLAASEDMSTAISYIQDKSGTYGIDPNRLAIGGFSAGAITAINTAYGANAPVQAVVSMSGSSWGYNLATTAKPGQPPILLLVGQNDLDGIRGGSSHMTALFKSIGVNHESAWVASFGHFYPMGAVSLAPDFTRKPVSERILKFLDTALEPSP